MSISQKMDTFKNIKIEAFAPKGLMLHLPNYFTTFMHYYLSPVKGLHFVKQPNRVIVIAWSDCSPCDSQL